MVKSAYVRCCQPYCSRSCTFFRQRRDQLIARLAAEWELDTPPQGSKISLRKHLERVWKATGKKPAKLQTLDNTHFPEELSYIYQWFAEFYSGQPFSYVELQAWCQLTGRILDPIEVDIIRWLTIIRENPSQR
ncbi:phage tail assembly chaperone [Budvicia aquatica]|uniref:phage tail assembly chaperone n=1 Tax=Budvicia aquatica TaxID=82979 RepID=UPI0040398E89